MTPTKARIFKMGDTAWRLRKPGATTNLVAVGLPGRGKLTLALTDERGQKASIALTQCELERLLTALRHFGRLP